MDIVENVCKDTVMVYARASILRARIAGILDWNSSGSAASQFLREMKYDPA